MQITIDMPVVAGCQVNECTYNVDSGCHARAITVGDGVHPGCDTFFVSQTHTGEKRRNAGVGACKVSGCRFNDDFECAADKIDVGYDNGSADCLTYAPS